MWKEGARDCQLSGRATEAQKSRGPSLLWARVAVREGSPWEVRAHPPGAAGMSPWGRSGLPGC